MKKAATHHDDDLFRDRGNSPHNGGGHRAERYTNIQLFFQSLNHFWRGNSYRVLLPSATFDALSRFAVIYYRLIGFPKIPRRLTY